jgi:hypothetical protein
MFRPNDSKNDRRTVVAHVEKTHFIITDYDNEQVMIAKADGVIGTYYVQVGNSGVSYMYMIHKDGSVVRMDISENGARTIADLTLLKAIIIILVFCDRI